MRTPADTPWSLPVPLSQAASSTTAPTRDPTHTQLVGASGDGVSIGDAEPLARAELQTSGSVPRFELILLIFLVEHSREEEMAAPMAEIYGEIILVKPDGRDGGRFPLTEDAVIGRCVQKWLGNGWMLVRCFPTGTGCRDQYDEYNSVVWTLFEQI